MPFLQSRYHTLVALEPAASLADGALFKVSLVIDSRQAMRSAAPSGLKIQTVRLRTRGAACRSAPSAGCRWCI